MPKPVDVLSNLLLGLAIEHVETGRRCLARPAGSWLAQNCHGPIGYGELLTDLAEDPQARDRELKMRSYSELLGRMKHYAGRGIPWRLGSWYALRADPEKGKALRSSPDLSVLVRWCKRRKRIRKTGALLRMRS